MELLGYQAGQIFELTANVSVTLMILRLGSTLTFKDENKTIWRFDLDKNNAEIQRKLLLRNEILVPYF